MPLFHLFLIAIIQGVTEFLPVSSSGHLILLPALTGLQDQGQTLDVAVHVGTLAAVILYFWRDVSEALTGLTRLLRGRIDTRGAHLALLLIIATIPVVLLGLILKLSGLSDALRSLPVIATMMIVFGVILYWADQNGPTDRPAEHWTMRHAAIMGLWQAVALIPGTSRSGATITGARLLGYTRTDAARLAMLMSIPTIIASGALLGWDVVLDANAALLRDAAIAALLAGLAAFAALVIMIRLLARVSYTPYVIYRIALGIVLYGVWLVG